MPVSFNVLLDMEKRKFCRCDEGEDCEIEEYSVLRRWTLRAPKALCKEGVRKIRVTERDVPSSTKVGVMWGHEPWKTGNVWKKLERTRKHTRKPQAGM